MSTNLNNILILYIFQNLHLSIDSFIMKTSPGHEKIGTKDLKQKAMILFSILY
jgi:hypothetical protein